MTKHSDNLDKPENIMGTMPEGRLLVTISLPVIISMLIQALYNVVDSYFVAKISENALAAVSLAFPIQNLMIAVAIGTGVGINALLSRRLGENNQKAVNSVAMNGLFLAIFSSLLFIIFGLFFSRIFFESQTDVPEIIEGGTLYTSICTIISGGMFFQITFSRLLQSTGRTIYSMIGQIFGAVINIILDPILIFGLLGMPKMGIGGAALATVIGQILGALMAAWFNFTKNPDIEFKFKGFKPNWGTIKQIYSVGLPAILSTSVTSIMVFGMNKILISFSTSATAVLGIYFKLQSFIFMPIFGLNNGMIPIIAYNYGAKQKNRITKTVKLGLICASSIALIGFLLFQFFTKPILTIFIDSNSTVVIGIVAFKIISIGFLFAGIGIVMISTFQALGYGTCALFLQLFRQLVAILPIAWLLSLSGNIDIVWWAFPIADFLTLAPLLLVYQSIYRKKIRLL